MRAFVLVLLSGMSLAKRPGQLCMGVLAKDLHEVYLVDDYAAFFSVEPCLFHMWRQKVFARDPEMLAKLDTTEFLPEEVAPLIEEYLFPDASSFGAGGAFISSAIGLAGTRVRALARALVLMRILDDLGQLPRPAWYCVRPQSRMVRVTHLTDLQRDTFFALTFSLVITRSAGMAWPLLKRLASQEDISPVDLSQHVARTAIRHDQEWIKKMFLCFDS